ncbi:manganese-binding lipoprotein MntA [Sporosarcina sp. NCCP-2716]|uniref:metal ABC transporter solute-binding protein, Zn/Mn family n=1 Tax=Sporosarcina sp. NCCP-2716 TaxID=2943679 RepID=UPI0020424E04|nr:zinc ABC transporter substrate-binding protein [Sporosarcina sp. NCCP-2716]GKV69511.1 manganese-binding lipoprotein MntA [Sporosarcina sp. NCCP-2716]
MKKLAKWLGLPLLAVFLLAACGTGKESPDNSGSGDKLKVVTSFTIIADMVRQIGGDYVEVHNLVPSGTDPHEYEPLPNDIKAATDADVLFYNGLNLEGGDKGWFKKLTDSVHQKDGNIFNLTEHVKPMYLAGEDGRDEEMNPHAFIDPGVGIKMAEDITAVLKEKHPTDSDKIAAKGEEYINRLKELDKEYEERIQDIPEENRTLVTSERAFQYMASHYGLKEAFIWEIDTEENGSPKQIKDLVGFIKDHDVPVLFVESNVDTRPMETVSKETGVPIAEKPIYSDEIGDPGAAIDTYIKYLNYNIDLIHEELSKQR